MARTNDRDVELSQLSAIVDMMRAKGVIKLTHAGTEILMGPPAASKPKATEQDERANKREHYMNLLGRRHIPNEELDLLP